MDTSILGQISALRKMSVAELREQWLRLYGEPARSRNRDYLWKRLAWRVQELAQGGLSPRAKQRIEALAPDDLDRAASPKQAATVVDALVRMGFKSVEAERAVASLTDVDRPLGELIREALAVLSG